jgi:hypothetical protein
LAEFQASGGSWDDLVGLSDNPPNYIEPTGGRGVPRSGETTGQRQGLSRETGIDTPAPDRSLTFGGEDIMGFRTEHAVGREQAQQTYEGIWNDPRYRSIKDVPPLERHIHENGRENFRFPADWYEANKGNYSKRELKEMLALARERQRAVDVTFKPGAHTRQQEANADWFADRGVDVGTRESTGIGVQKEGKKHERTTPTNAVYGYDVGNEDWSNPEDMWGQGLEKLSQFDDLRPFVKLQEGDPITRANMATELERDQYNRARNLLDEADRIAESDPRQSAEIIAEVERYQAEEQKAFEMIADGMQQNGLSFQKAVSRARKEYRAEDDYDWIGYATIAILAVAAGAGPAYAAWGE